MPRESTIRIFRSDTAAAVPSLTAGEIAVNIPDQRLFVGNSTGGVIPFFGNGVSGINGITGGVSITSGSGITITQSGKQITVASSITQYTAPLATSSVTGVASFPNTDFSVSAVGAVSLTANVARTHIGQSFSGLQVFSSGLSANGLTGTILTPAQTNITSLGTLTSLNTAGITSTQRVTISSGGLSVAGNIDGTIGTAAQTNITSLGSLTTLTTAGLTSTQRVNVSAGGIVVQAGGLSVTGGANLTGGSTFFGDIEVFDGAFIRTGGISVTGGIAGTLVTPAQTNITSVGVLSGLSVNNGLSVTGSATITGGLNAYGNTTTWGSLAAKSTVNIEMGGLRSQLGATFGDPNYGFGNDPVINLYRANNELLRIGAARGGNYLGGLNNQYVFDILGPNTAQTRLFTFRRATNFDGASASNHVTIMSFDTSDNVGIRTASPGATFDVNGTFRSLGRASFPVGLTSANLFVDGGATFGADIYAPNMVTGVNGITGAVSLTSGSNITITQSGKQITIAGGVTWSVVTADQTLTNNTGSFANKSTGTLALTLPTTAAVGTTIRVSGMQNAWRLAQNASQKINFGRFSTTTGTGGYIESTDARDSVELVCCVANTEWNVVSSIGNMTIV